MADKYPARPEALRVIVFVDGQNLYNDCRNAFGHGKVDPHLLGKEIKPIDPKTGRRPPYKRLKSAGRIIRLDEEVFERIRDDTNYLP